MSDNRTQPTDREECLDEAVAAYFQAADAGCAPDRQAWLARYPDVTGELEHFFAGIERVDRLAAPFRLLAPAVSGVTNGDGADGLGRLGDFHLLREVGRGGMGVVYEAEQFSLGRQVALKVLSFAATMDPKHLQRFENEARAAASLHHPNIVPVYAVGCERGLRFYAMQFVDGQTLAELIAAQREERLSPSPTPPQIPAPVTPSLPAAKTSPKGQETTSKAPPAAAYYRRVAEWGVQVAEALEHAHGLGIIHRDVKPGNLMIDGGGKLWVTDFGLARVAADTGLTMTGDMLGTLRYMSPEQAQAKHGLVDHRTDIYSLGATLYELATLEPAVSGKDREEIFRRITLEDPTPLCALDRTIPAELEIIVLKAMAKEPQDRYATAQELADDLRRWLEDRPIQARRPSLYQRLRKWTRRHWPAVTAAAVCLLVTLTAAAGSGGWVLGDRATRQRESEARVLEALEAAAPGLRQGNPQDLGLITAQQRAEAQLNTGPVGPELRGRVEQLRRDLKMLRRLESTRMQYTAGSRETGLDYAGADQLYAQAFKEYGLDVIASNTQEAVERILSSAIRTHLVMALGEWAFARNQLHRGTGALLDQVAELADDDPWRQRLRGAVRRRDRVALEGLAKEDGIASQSPDNLEWLASSLAYEGSGAAAEQLLRQAQQEYPKDFWINHDLAVTLLRKQPADGEQAARFCQAALALRSQSPVVYVNLGNALSKQGKYTEAEAACRKAIQLKPDLAEAHGNLGIALRHQGKLAAAEAAHRKAIKLKPELAGEHHNLGRALRDQRKLAEAEAAFRKAIQLMPNHVGAHQDLGTTLLQQGKLAEAEAPIRKAIALKPDYAIAHSSLGYALINQKKLDEAVAAYRKAIALEPDSANAHLNLGIALQRQGKQAEAEAAYRKAIELQPANAMPYFNLGNLLNEQKRWADAVAAFRKAVAIKPDWAAAHNNLGNALFQHGKPAEAEAAYRKAIALEPDMASAHFNLGRALQEQGRFADALAALKRGHELGSRRPDWPSASAQWVREAAQWAALDDKLPRFLSEEAQPADASEGIALAHLCVTYKKRYAAGARFYAAAFAAQPALADDLVGEHRYAAACAAALAGCRQGKDAADLSDKERAHLRRQALDWLRADLTAWRRLLDKGSEKKRPALVNRMRHWLDDSDFAGVRGAEAVARLPDAERLVWRRLWADVADTLAAALPNAVAEKSEAKSTPTKDKESRPKR